MITSRVVLLAVLLGNCVVVSMESVQKQEISVQNVLDTIIESQFQRKLSDTALVELYLYTGGNINAKGTIFVSSGWQDIKGANLLMVSVFYDRPKLMKFLIGKYARLDCKNEFGDTALIMAAMTGRAALVRILLDAGADKNIRNNGGRTALDEAYNSPWRYNSFYNNKDRKIYNFPIMIRLLEHPNQKKVQYYKQIDNIKNHS